MRAIDVSTDDIAVVDCEGTVWVYGAHGDKWAYLLAPEDDTEDPALSQWDSRADLPAEYEPYVRLDDSALRVVLRAIGATRLLRG